MIKSKPTTQSTNKYDHQFKILVFGESFAGKTSLIERFMDDKFSNPHPTIGCALTTKSISILGKIIRLEIWDTSRYISKDLIPIHNRGSKGVIFVYDISSRDTFDELQKWWNDILSSILTQTVFLLIGNKTDLTAERQVSFDEGQRFAEKNQMLFFECSAKTGENVDRAFNDISIKIYQQESIKKAASSKNVINGAQKKSKSFFNWFNRLKNAKPKPNSKEIKEKEANTVEKDEKIEEKS